MCVENKATAPTCTKQQQDVETNTRLHPLANSWGATAYTRFKSSYLPWIARIHIIFWHLLTNFVFVISSGICHQSASPSFKAETTVFVSNMCLLLVILYSRSHTSVCTNIFRYISTSASSKEWHNDVHQNQSTNSNLHMPSGRHQGGQATHHPPTCWGESRGGSPPGKSLTNVPGKKGRCWKKEIHLPSFFQGIYRSNSQIV